MKRSDIISKVGKQYLASNIENEEFSYQKALKAIGKDIADYYNPKWKRKYKDLDLRFADDKLSVLIETKDNYDKWNIDEVFEQINAYITYEKELTTNKIVAIIANTDDDRLMVFYGESTWADNTTLKSVERVLKTFEEYKNIYYSGVNNKIKVIQSTYSLNELLHKHGIGEKIRSQFVGTCLLALKNGLIYNGLPTPQIISGIETILSSLLKNDLNRANKLVILKNNVLDVQSVSELPAEDFRSILRKIENEILPYINDTNTAGQDLLNLFFTTFNKYVEKDDKNQAFTPDHIVHFMCKVVGVNRNSRVLDPCCGSGAFLVRALTEALDDCDTEEDKDRVKKQQIYGIEYDNKCYGLSTTNMLIHGDGNSNVIQGSCFDKAKFIENAKINVVLMNPPYNAIKVMSNPEYVKTWGPNTSQDPSKGLHYVHWIASQVKTGKLAVLLPMACAIGGKNKDINKFKELMMQEHTLDAVFSLPKDIFHPGSTSVACCMIFDLGTRHSNAAHKETFFGYYKDDGFKKRKNLGRIEKVDLSGVGVWKAIEEKWLDCYRKRLTIPGLCVTKEVGPNDEWLAEAYMDTEYSDLTFEDFEKTIRDYVAYLIKKGDIYE